MATALTSAPGPSADGDNVLVPRAVIADLYRFLHNTWVGEGRVTDEGSHGKDLLDWRQTMSHYHRQPAATQGNADEDPAERS